MSMIASAFTFSGQYVNTRQGKKKNQFSYSYGQRHAYACECLCLCVLASYVRGSVLCYASLSRPSQRTCFQIAAIANTCTNFCIIDAFFYARCGGTVPRRSLENFMGASSPEDACPKRALRVWPGNLLNNKTKHALKH